MTQDTLRALAQIIKERRSQSADASYTRQLLDAGADKCAKKFGEECIEAVIAAVGEDDDRVANEAADVLYHLLVLLEARGISYDRVADILDSRMGTSGLTEKASRGQPT